MHSTVSTGRRGLLVVACALLLCAVASCAHPGQPSAAPASASPSAVGPLTRWRAWRPSEPAVPTRVDKSQEAGIRETWLREEYPDDLGPVPDTIPALVAWDTPDGSRALSCLQEAGWQARAAGPGGGVIVDQVMDGQESAWRRAYWECEARFTPPVVTLVPWSESQEGTYYDYYTSFWMPCVEEQGNVYVGPEPPSRQAWVAQALAGSADLWSPMDDASWKEPIRDWEELGWVCPIQPPPAAMYGEEDAS